MKNMNKLVYLDQLELNVYSKITLFFSNNNIKNIVNDYIMEPCINYKHIREFYEYYFNTIGNEKYFLETPNFLQEFCVKYGVNGIDVNHFKKLDKNIILYNIRNGYLVQLYLNYFRDSNYGEVTERNLNYLFSKLVHTFKPDEYTALDDNIKNYFGLKKESFYLAFEIISSTYVEWSRLNSEIMSDLWKELKSIDKTNIFKSEKTSAIKLLDTIFWSYCKQK